jgi:hypothetical protein
MIVPGGQRWRGRTFPGFKVRVRSIPNARDEDTVDAPVEGGRTVCGEEGSVDDDDDADVDGEDPS